MAHLPVYIPAWLKTELQSGDLFSVICERVELKNGLTHGLIAEIEAAFSTADDLEVGTGANNKASFAEWCGQLFSPGCVGSCKKILKVVIIRLLGYLGMATTWRANGEENRGEKRAIRIAR